jgi:hypothetical protein
MGFVCDCWPVSLFIALVGPNSWGKNQHEELVPLLLNLLNNLLQALK